MHKVIEGFLLWLKHHQNIDIALIMDGRVTDKRAKKTTPANTKPLYLLLMLLEKRKNLIFGLYRH